MAVCENAMLPTFNISENYKLALNLLQETRNSHSQEKALFFVLMNNKKLRGGVKKKTCTFGWSRPQNGDPPPSPSSGQSTSFFCRNFFYAYNPLKRKKN